jgi:hypothetical protein
LQQQQALVQNYQGGGYDAYSNKQGAKKANVSNSN